PGIEGTVVNVKVFTRRGVEKDLRTLEIEADEIASLEKDLNDEIRILREENRDRVLDLVDGKKAAQKVTSGGKVLANKGDKLDRSGLEGLSYDDLLKIKVDDEEAVSVIASLKERVEKQIQTLKEQHEERVERIQKGD